MCNCNNCRLLRKLMQGTGCHHLLDVLFWSTRPWYTAGKSLLLCMHTFNNYIAVYTIMHLFLVNDFQSLSSGVLMIMLVHHSETYTCPSPKTKPLSFMFLRRLLPHIHRLQYLELHWKLERTCTLSFRRAIYNYQHFAVKLAYHNWILLMYTSTVHVHLSTV